MVSKNKPPFVSWNRLKSSFVYALRGIRRTWRSEQNFRIHSVMFVVVILLAQLLNVPPVEQAVLMIVIGAVIGLELINTSLESIVDLVVQEYDERAKIIKDAAAGAVFIFSLTAVIVGLIIFIPRMIETIL